MRERLPAAGDGAAQLGVQRQPQAIAGERLMNGGVPGGQGQRGGVLEHLAALEVLEVRPRYGDAAARAHA